MAANALIGGILAHLPADLIRACYAAAPGNEIASGKFLSPESSAALSANAFGYFLDKPAQLPPLPVDIDLGSPFGRVAIEAECRFPWSGGRHPWLDVVLETETVLCGIESKRFEPFRTRKVSPMSDAYWRPVWGEQMTGICSIRDDLKSGTLSFDHLDAAQLIKHAFGLRSCVHRIGPTKSKRPVLIYLHAEPQAWPDGRPISIDAIAKHRREIEEFASRIAGDEVAFGALSYRELLRAWREGEDPKLREHAIAVQDVFLP